MALLSIVAILGSIVAGFVIFQTYGSGGADAAYDAIALMSSILWIMAGIFLILGGFVVVGSLVLVAFTYIFAAKGEQTGDRVRKRLK